MSLYARYAALLDGVLDDLVAFDLGLGELQGEVERLRWRLVAEDVRLRTARLRLRGFLAGGLAVNELSAVLLDHVAQRRRGLAGQFDGLRITQAGGEAGSIEGDGKQRRRHAFQSQRAASAR